MSNDIEHRAHFEEPGPIIKAHFLEESGEIKESDVKSVIEKGKMIKKIAVIGVGGLGAGKTFCDQVNKFIKNPTGKDNDPKFINQILKDSVITFAEPNQLINEIKASKVNKEQ
jgi:hypothetical protein